LFASAAANADNAWLDDLANFLEDFLECGFGVDFRQLGAFLEEGQ
jgi:hypothetical protein